MRTCGLGFLLTFLVVLTPSFASSNIISIHHTLTVRLDPQKHFLEVSDDIEIRGSGMATFHLAPSLSISIIKKDGQVTSVSRQRKTFKIPLGNKKQHRLTLKYKGTFPILSGKKDGLSREHSIISGTGSYLPPQSAWHPYIEGVASSYKLNIITPEDHKAVVPGRLIKEQKIDGFYNAAFESEIPAIGIVLIAGRYIVNERRYKKVLLRTYFSSNLAELSDQYLDTTIKYIDYFERLIGDYPFSSFSIISGPIPIGLGFPGMTYMGEMVLKLPFIRFTSLGHEVLHNWWGNGVKVDYKKGNWAEGLTTYMADYTFSERKNAKSARQMRKEWLRDYAALPNSQDKPVRSFISKKHDASQIIGYNKVAFIFHMLSHKVGKKSFERSIRKFWKRHKFQTASWEDLQKIFEEISGLNLQTFFHQWIDRKGAPKLIMSDVKFEAEKLSLKLIQSNQSYSLDIPIKIVKESGVELIQVSISNKVSVIDLKLSEPPKSIVVDPNFDVFRILEPSETSPILRDVTLDPNSVVFLISDDENMQKIAKKLATKLLANTPHFLKKTQISNQRTPLLIVGSSREVAKFLQEKKFPTTPNILYGRGSARVWATRHLFENGVLLPLLVIEANNPQALKYLLKPLPHYGRRSYLIFNSATVAESGVWPEKHNSLSTTHY